LLEEAMLPDTRVGLQPADNPYYLNASAVGATTGEVQTLLYYLDYHQPIWYDFPLPNGTFSAELIDTQQGTSKPLEGRYTGTSKLQLVARPYQSVRFHRI